MSRTTINISTDSILKREAQSYFESIGLTLEAGLTQYMQLVLDQEDDDPLTIREVADSDVPEDVRKALAEFDKVPKEDLVVFSRETHAHQ